MTVTQSQFSRAILDPDLSVPTGLTDPFGRPDGKRFAVYRNNVVVSLTDALATAFPVLQKLVGEEFFRAMAGVFVRKHPPTSALMMFYGQDMPEFLERFEPAQEFGYLPDIAHLELALRQSYHAADVAPIDPSELQSMPPDILMASRLILAPAVRLLSSDWPVHAIYQANTQTDAPPPVMQPETILVTRPEFDPIVNLLDDRGAAFVSTLTQHGSFGSAVTAAGDGFDLGQTLGMLLAGGAISKIENEMH